MEENDLRIDSSQSDSEATAPDLPYGPSRPEPPLPGIGLVGCGAVSAYHLEAYKAAGLPVLALCDRNADKVAEKRDRFYPDATSYTEYRKLLERHDIAIVDLTPHPEGRAEMIEAALNAGKHVLSQKPFVIDLDEGQRLVEMAEGKGLLLSVNQNGRWAPHFSYMRHAVEAGLIGDVISVHMAIHWDHSWTAGSPFDEIRHLVLYDFGIHWFDMVSCLIGDREPRSVFAQAIPAAQQPNRVPLLAHATVAYEDAQASLTFDAFTRYGASDTTTIVGTKGTLTSTGPDLGHQTVTLSTKEGVARPALEGEWFSEGFLGTMTELIAAMQEGRTPANNARDNLKSLALCFAAMKSADEGRPVAPGSARRIS